MSASAVTPIARLEHTAAGWKTTVAAASFSVILAAFLVVGSHSGDDLPLSLVFVATAFLATGYIVRWGRAYTVRAALLVLSTLLFTAIFEIEHQVTRGSILLGEAQVSANATPICPITLGFVVPPLVLRGEMIFPATMAAFEAMLFVWLGFALLFGRAWCGWLCFFGGVDQFFAALGPTRKGGRPLVEIPQSWLRYARLFPYALLLFLAVVAVASFEPLFCAWLCPLRLAYDPPVVTTTLQWLNAVGIVSLGMGLLVVGPFLTKKRLFCSYVCPLLPLNAAASFVSPFRMGVDRSQCRNCGLCVRACPHSALTEAGVAAGKVGMACTRCGKCSDVCPRGAIQYRLIGRQVKARAAFVALAVSLAVMFIASYTFALLAYVQTGKVPVIGGA